MRLRRILLATVVLSGVLTVSGVAWGFWTTTGTGTGQATVARTAPELTLHATVGGELLPGANLPVAFTADNPTPTDLQVGTIHLDSVTPDRSGCDPGDFSLADVRIDQTVPGHRTGYQLSGTGVLHYANTALDQSACIGAQVTLSISSG